MKRIISLILAFVLLAFVLVSCDKGSSKSNNLINDLHNSLNNNNNNGTGNSDQISASSENFEVTYPMMDYFVNSYIKAWYSQYYYYILFGYIQFDPAKPLQDQYTDSTNTQTYYDYFVYGSKTTVELYLKYCEAAKADPYVDFNKLQKDAEEYADNTIKSLEEAAKSQGGSIGINFGLSKYISDNFGKTVTVDVLKKCLIIEHIGSSYYQIIYERAINSVTEAQEDKYFADHLDYFVAAECVSVTLPSSEAERINLFAEAENADVFYALAEEFGYINNINNRSLAYNIETDLGRFIFSGVKEQYGIETGKGEKNAELYDTFVEERSGNTVVYMVTKPASRKETILRDVGHILFKVDSSKETDPSVSYQTVEEAMAAAEHLLGEMQSELVNGKVSKERFEEFAVNTHDSSVFYQNVNKGDMVQEFEDWLFNATVEGEIGLVQTTYGLHIMYYGGETGEIAWRMKAHEEVAMEDIMMVVDGFTYAVTFDDSVFEEIMKEVIIKNR